jgi:hypothetical protein
MDVTVRNGRYAPLPGSNPIGALVWIGEDPVPRLGKKDKPLRTSGICAGLPKKPDPSLL